MKRTNKFIASVAFGLFVLTGTYNAVVINSESNLSGSDIKFVKRLDELYGVTVPGREVAASMNWKKLDSAQVRIRKENIVHQPVTSIASAPVVEASPSETQVAAVQEELSLSLVEVINPKKWSNGLSAAQFNGSLSTNNGVIENLAVSLPNGEGVSVSFSEMTGNVFEYDLNGELYSGMMYQVDQNAYMVTLTNGPLEGTRMRFSSQPSEEEQIQAQESLAHNNVEVGNFGHESNNENAYENLVKQSEQSQQDVGVQTDEKLQQAALSHNEQQLNLETVAPSEQEQTPESELNNDQLFQQEGLQAQGLDTVQVGSL